MLTFYQKIDNLFSYRSDCIKRQFGDYRTRAKNAVLIVLQ